MNRALSNSCRQSQRSYNPYINSFALVRANPYPRPLFALSYRCYAKARAIPERFSIHLRSKDKQAIKYHMILYFLNYFVLFFDHDFVDTSKMWHMHKAI